MHRTPLTGNVDLSHVIDRPPQASGQAYFDVPKSDAAIAADNRQMMQLFAKATEQYLTFDSMASDDAASAEARRNQLDRIESIRRADVFSTLSDSRAIDVVTIFAKGHYATAIATQWASTAGTKDWANFMEMLYKLFYSTLYQPSLEAVKCLKMGPAETLQAYSTRCAAAIRRYCATIHKDPANLPDETRLEILKWVLAGLPKAVASIIHGLREQKWIQETKDNTLKPLQMLEELGTIDELMRFNKEVRHHRANIHMPAGRHAGLAGGNNGREPRGQINAIYNDDSDSSDEDPNSGAAGGACACSGGNSGEEEECLFMLDASRPASSYPIEFTSVFLAGEDRFAAPEEVTRPAGRVCFSCGNGDHLSNKCPSYNSNLPHATPEQRARLMRNAGARSRLVFSNHGVEGKNIPKSGNKVGRSTKGSQ
jgi:hypothetical protein